MFQTELNIGEVIKNRRIMLGLSQSELAEGIMHVTNLSKLENGRQIPNRDNLDMLLQRLGINEPKLHDLNIPPTEFAVAEKKKLLNKFIFENKLSEAEDLIHQLEVMKEFGSADEYAFNRQFLLSCRAAVADINNDTAFVESCIYQALSITAGSFNEEHIAARLYTNYELELINMLALSYAENGDRARGIKILKDLVKSIEQSCMNRIIDRKFSTGILYNLSKYLSMENRRQEALEVCNRGINLCYDSSMIYALPQLYYNKACILHKLSRVKEYKHYIEFSCNLSYEMGRIREAKERKKRAEQRFGLTLNVMFSSDEES